MCKKVLWFILNKIRFLTWRRATPVNHVVTVECFINDGCTTRKPVILLCVI